MMMMYNAQGWTHPRTQPLLSLTANTKTLRRTNMRESISTAITELFGIERPIMLAGMNVAAGPELAAEVTNNGGLGVIGGVGYTPKFLRDQLDELKSYLKGQECTIRC